MSGDDELMTAAQLEEKVEALALTFEDDRAKLTVALAAAAEADEPDAYIAMCEVLGLELVDPTFDIGAEGACSLCGLVSGYPVTHRRWHHRMQAASRVTNFMLSMTQTEAQLYGTLLRLLVHEMAEGEE